MKMSIIMDVPSSFNIFILILSDDELCLVFNDARYLIMRNEVCLRFRAGYSM